MVLVARLQYEEGRSPQLPRLKRKILSSEGISLKSEALLTFEVAATSSEQTCDKGADVSEGNATYDQVMRAEGSAGAAMTSDTTSGTFVNDLALQACNRSFRPHQTELFGVDGPHRPLSSSVEASSG